MFKKIILRTIKFYQIFISPNFGKNCRFYPTCSEYSYISIKKYGVIKGLCRGVKRIIKCNPCNPGGLDLP